MTGSSRAQGPTGSWPRREHRSLSITVLYVEPRDHARHAGTELLSDFGFEVLEARDASEAYRYVEQDFEPDVLVTELELPDADGTELARRLRRTVPRLGVVFISAYAPDDPALASPLSEPCTTYLSKPLDVELLARTIWHSWKTCPRNA